MRTRLLSGEVVLEGLELVVEKRVVVKKILYVNVRHLNVRLAFDVIKKNGMCTGYCFIKGVLYSLTVSLFLKVCP